MAKAKVVTSRTQGAPGFGPPKSNWPRVPRSLRRRRNVRVAIADDPSDGLTQPEFANLTDAHGVATPGRGGYKGATSHFQTPQTPPKSGANTTRIKSPRLGRLKRR